MANWFVLMAGNEQGPFTDRQLKQLANEGRVNRTDLVRREDQQNSCEAQKLKGLFETPPLLPPTSPGIPPINQQSGVQMAQGPAQPNFGSQSGPQIEIRKTPLKKQGGIGTKVAVGCVTFAFLLFVLCAGLAQLGRSVQRNSEVKVARDEPEENEFINQSEEDAIRAMVLAALAIDENRKHRTPEEFIGLMRMAASEFKADEKPEFRHLLTIEPSDRNIQRDPEITIMTLLFGKAGPKATLVQFRETSDGYVLMGAVTGNKCWIVHKDTGALVNAGQRP